jgi:hypothetical protein
MKRCQATLGIVAVAAALSPAPVAAAGGAATTVTIHRNVTFHGRVTSAKHSHKCRRGRNITIRLDKPNSALAVAHARTNRKGRYVAPVDVHGHHGYFAVAAQKTLKSGFVCQRGESHVIRF